MKLSYGIGVSAVLALAACTPPATTTTTTTTTTMISAPPPRMIVNSAPTAELSPANCGTPFDFQACPPMPKKSLPYYPKDKQ